MKVKLKRPFEKVTQVIPHIGVEAGWSQIYIGRLISNCVGV